MHTYIYLLSAEHRYILHMLEMMINITTMVMILKHSYYNRYCDSYYDYEEGSVQSCP